MSSVEMYINMNSGKNRRGDLRTRKFRKIVGDNGQVFATKTVDQLELIVEDMPKRRPKSVIIDTGDGGLGIFISLLVKTYGPKLEELPSIAVLGGGSFEFFAKQCNAPKKRKDVKKYIEQIIKDEGIYRQNIDFMKITDNKGIESYGFNFGVGAVVTLLEEIYKHKTWKWAGVAFVLTKLYLSRNTKGPYYQIFNQKTPLEVAISSGEDVQRFDGDYFALMAQTIKSIGLRGSETFYIAQERAGYFHARGVTEELGEVMKLTNLAKIYSGSVFGKPDMQANSMSLRSEEQFPYTVNGELESRTNGHTVPYLANEVEVKHGVTLKIIKVKSAE
ncbi:MAG: hypothetical protein KJ955_05905 [Nanoarchaeota archaeon]|nr:hypothetical protein [Nanoarchaeota archaeon]